MKKTFVLIIVMLCTGMTYSQNNSFKKNINYSVQLGFPLGGYENSIKEALTNQHFNHQPGCFIFCPAQEHPHSRGSLHLAVGVDYVFHPNQSIGATLGMINGFGFISGYNNLYGSMDFKYDEYSLTTYYRFFEPSRIFLMEGGISGNAFSYRRIDSEYHFDAKSRYVHYRPGIMLGLKIKIRETEGSYFRLGIQFNQLLGKIKLGPFKSQYTESYFDQATTTWIVNDVIENTFQEEEISLNKFTLLFTYGIK